ncbi:hypothetical protein L1987_57161 [Smallanthus sonchifolius]|uniref:Uncharacterized protein n=1 Tax=Smallanthus sonchifolius TaxID=185202 RepID=A0ACB9DCU0_9ASTR|nr:hypothetical protein L1987_57161 [Smallanthus sonchifolius]
MPQVCNNLAVTTALAVLYVLMVADKFDVASCVRHCNRLLRNLPMTPESILVYLDLPSTILIAEEFQSLTVTAKQFYAVHYKDITNLRNSFDPAIVLMVVSKANSFKAEVPQDIDENSNLCHRFVARLFTHDTGSVVFGPDYTEQLRNQVVLRHILVLQAIVAENTSQTMALRAELLARADQTNNRLTELETVVVALQNEDNSD